MKNYQSQNHISMKKIVTYSEAINSGLNFCLKSLKNTLVIGQGVDAIDGVFGTTKNLANIYGKKENSLIFQFQKVL